MKNQAPKLSCHDSNAVQRKSQHSQGLKSNLISRLNRIEGQTKAVKRMIEEDTYCDDILNLVASIQSALSSTSALLMEHHMKSCVLDQIKAGQPEVIDELMKTIRRQMK